jgi:hypothetical protein
MTALTITAQDTATTSTASQGGQNLITGTPTANSSQVIPVTGSGALGIQITGTWTGTLAFEKSMDGGVTYAAADAVLQGIDAIVQSVTQNCIVHVAAAASSHVRVRSTASMTGTANITGLGTVVTDAEHVVVANNTKSALNIIQKNPTISTSAYSANNVVGGIQTLAGAVRKPNGFAVLESVSVIDAAAQGAQLSIFFFKALPTGGTYADHGGLTLAAADLPNFLGKVDIAAANYDPTGSGVKSATGTALGLAVQGDSSGNVYAIATTTGTPTFTALALTFNYGFTQA